jgi:hypothetical protein
MRTSTLPTLIAAAGFALLAGAVPAFGQPPPADPKPAKEKPPKKLPDETRAVVNEIEEAYKAPLEFHEDVLDELRKQYKNPTPEREAKLFYEIRRLHATTPEAEQAILHEVRRAYELRTPEQEARLFAEIRRSPTLPPGTVHPTTRVEQAGKLFRRLDQDGDGRLGPAELTDALRGQQRRWDRNRDGFVDAAEYGEFFQSHHEVVAAAVEAGEIPLKLPKGVAGPGGAPAGEARRPAVQLPKGLPNWFAEYDADRDGQVGLYEWRWKKRPIREFVPMDRNGDGYLTPAELLHFLAEQAKADPKKAP